MVNAIARIFVLLALLGASAHAQKSEKEKKKIAAELVAEGRA